MMIHWKAVLCVLVLFQTVVKAKENRNAKIVKTSHGKIKGRVLQTLQKPHLKYYAFTGIPYAKPPLKELRFKPPVQPEPWNGIKSCEQYGNPCLQISTNNGSVFGSEDCLTLNVFTKELKPKNLKAVMFWIHGGAHIRGSSSLFKPDYLIERDIVLVTVIYRLNIFGFLTVNDENAFGNTAIKDQIAALEWVQSNIMKFGGDPSRVTIFGESSGANSVSLLQLCRRTKGLYHQIIAQSGSALNPRYLQRDPLKYVHNIAKYFDVSTETTKDIVEGLQKVDDEKLTKAAHSSNATGYHTDLHASPFYPIIEVENYGAVITRTPYELLTTGKFNQVPFITGYNTNEGTLGLKIVSSGMTVDDFDKKYELFASLSLNNPSHQNSVGMVVRQHFLRNSSARDSEEFSKFLGQELIVRGVRKAVDFQRKHSRGYFYRFGYKGTKTTPLTGVGHAEELQYLFPMDGAESFNEHDILTRRRMGEMWTNFAIFGSPVPDDKLLSENISWKKCESKGSLNFLNVGNKLTQGNNPDDESYIFWRELFSKFGVQPYETY